MILKCLQLYTHTHTHTDSHLNDKNKIIAVVVTHNRKELLKENIEALLNQTYKEFDILIVDNASTDNTYIDVVKQYDTDKLSYINTGKNIGRRWRF